MTGVDLWGASGAHAPLPPKINGTSLSPPSIFRRKNEEEEEKEDELPFHILAGFATSH